MNRRDPFIAPIVGVLVVAVAPQVVRLPMWIIFWCGLLWGYTFVASEKGFWLPGKMYRQVMTAAGFVMGMATYNFAFDLDAGIGLLSIMVGLKPLEIRSHRDRMMTLFLTYFMVITNLLYTNALAMTIYMAVSVFLTTAVLIHVCHPGGATRAKLRMSAKILVQAIPLALVLFLFFPRLHGSLWGSPNPAVGESGFSDHLQPGSITDIVRNRAIAFRVEFKGEVPRRDRLYWRGLVFQHFNGVKWYRGMQPPKRLVPITGTNRVDYTVTLEPHGKKWLFALDMPSSGMVPAAILSDHTLSTRRKLYSRLRYRIKSFTQYRAEHFYPWESTTLTLPDKGNPKSRMLAAKWKRQTDDPKKIVEMAIDFFRDNPFVYTLQAPMLGSNRIDDFLFETRSGYCEYYASAFAFLMRSANIPSRIIGGYLGGEINPFGNYLIVRQSDAHAWVEVWLSGMGWVRVDPTSVVAPARVEEGVAAALAPGERSVFMDFAYLGPFSKHVKNLGLGWDMVNSSWNRWVLGYSYRRQQTLFSKLGMHYGSFKGPVSATLMVLVSLGLGMYGVVIYSRKRHGVKKDNTVVIYQKFCEKMANIGLHRNPSQGPRDYAGFVSAVRPDLSRPVQRITDDYIHLRYAGRKNRQTRIDFRTAVYRFHPKKKS